MKLTEQYHQFMKYALETYLVAACSNGLGMQCKIKKNYNNNSHLLD